MRRNGSWNVLRLVMVLVLFFTPLLICGKASAGVLSGAQRVGVYYDDGDLTYVPGMTLDYAQVSHFFLTFDVQAKYNQQTDFEDIEIQYDLSANYYPDWRILKGFALSIGATYEYDKTLSWYMEFERPFN